MGCHSLPIVTGRWEGIPRADRICLLCRDSRALGDERHLLLECNALSAIRQEYADLLLSCRDSMQRLIWHPDQILVFRYVRDCLRFHADHMPADDVAAA